MESLEPGASIAGVARKHGIGTGQLYAWRHQLLTRHTGASAHFARVEILPEPRRSSEPRTGLIEIVLSDGASVRVDAQVDEPALHRVLAALRA